MHQVGQNVTFLAGLHENYVSIEEKDLNTIYFCTDTQQLFVGETEYTRPVQYGGSLPTGYLPPNSLFYHTGEKALYFSQDGTSWQTVSNFYIHPSFTARTLGQQTGATLAYGGTFKVPSITVDSQGHVTAGADQTFTLPAAPDIPGSPVDKLAGKTILCAGDSLMRGNGWLGGFRNCLAEAHPNTTIDNIAVSGASLCESDSNPNIFDQLAAKVSTPYDILLLTGGGNDLISGLTVGEPNLTKNGTAGDWLTTCNALDTDLYRVHDYWPECKIFFLSLSHWSYRARLEVSLIFRDNLIFGTRSRRCAVNMR